MPSVLSFNPFRPLLDRLRGRRNQATSSDDAARLDHLHWLRQRHSFIDVRSTRLEAGFQTLLLDIDPVLGELTLDEFYPPAGSEQLETGDLLEITSRNGDRPLHFITRLLGREQRDDQPIYRVEIPASIGVNGTRQAYRVYVDGEPGLAIDVACATGEALPCRVVNLSVDGIKLDIEGDAGALLERQRNFDNCLMRLPGDIDIDCSVELRNHRLLHAPVAHTLAGGVLHVHQANHRVKLAQFLAAVQRRQRRRELRLMP